MSVLIACVGRLKEKFYADGCGVLEKRIGRFFRLEIRQLADEPEKNGDVSRVLEAEGARILKEIRPEDYVFAMAIQGEALSSEDFAARLTGVTAQKRAVFVVGGSRGLSEAVYKRVNERISMSAMTFNHNLARLMLLEQIYRAGQIASGGRYHK